MTVHYAETMKLISQFSGQQGTITVPRPFCRVMGSIQGGIVLNQLIFWADKGSNPDGWVWKSLAEWTRETMLPRYQVEKAVDFLVQEGVLETIVKKAKGSPTVHYRFKEAEFSKWFCSFAQKEMPISTNGSADIDKTITVDHSEDSTEEIPEDGGAGSAPLKAKKTAQEVQANIEEATEVHTHQGLVDLYAGDGNLNLTRLGHFWRLAVIMHHSKVGAMPPLTVKEKSQLKNVVGKLEEPVVQKLGLVIREWYAYTAHCEMEHGAFNTPGSPNIPFVTKFANGVESYWVKVHGTGITPLKGGMPQVTVTHPD